MAYLFVVFPRQGFIGISRNSEQKNILQTIEQLTIRLVDAIKRNFLVYSFSE